MNILLAVSRKPLEMNYYNSYWCTRKKYLTVPGDLLFVYVKMVGISQIFEVKGLDTEYSEILCRIRRMLTIRIVHKIDLTFPISASMLKKDNALSESNFVRRNFQGTTFQVSEEVRNPLISLIQDKNPECADLVSLLVSNSDPHF